MGMDLESVLARSRTVILDTWFEKVCGLFPADSTRFFREEGDPFANPIGNTFSQAIAVLYDALTGKADPGAAEAAIASVMRILAIQKMPASRALGFLFSLKPIVRDRLCEEIGEPRGAAELLAFESRIDDLALRSFDHFLGCREKIYELRTREIKNRTAKLLERSGLVVPDESPVGD